MKEKRADSGFGWLISLPFILIGIAMLIGGWYTRGVNMYKEWKYESVVAQEYYREVNDIAIPNYDENNPIYEKETKYVVDGKTYTIKSGIFVKEVPENLKTETIYYDKENPEKTTVLKYEDEAARFVLTLLGASFTFVGVITAITITKQGF